MKKIFLITAVLVAGVTFIAFANLEQQKLYKTAFPDSKPKCITCHVDAIPKKDEGKHDWNAYGKEVKKQAVRQQAAQKTTKPTLETYKAVGPAEKFQDKK